MAALARVTGYRSRALTILMVAGAMLNRTGLARRALDRLRRLDEPVDRQAVADAWCRGLFGRLLLDQCSARAAGADPHTGRIHRLLREAAGVFHDELGKGDRSISPPERRDLRNHLTVCKGVSDQRRDVAHAPAPPLAALSA